MVNYQLTNKAEKDMENIYEYSILNFGLRVARDYISGIHTYFSLLADNPSWGTDYSFIESDLFRYEYRSHSVYYQKTKQGILIVRVLGSKQNPIIHIS